METFTIDILNETDMTTLIISGILNEDFVQADSVVPLASHVRINLKKLKSINSCGLRDFINFLRRFPETTIVEFEHCPAFFIQQVNMVGGILNKMRTISSFYAPYIAIESEEEVSVYFETNKILPTEIPQSITREGKIYEFDGSFEKFFRFLSIKY